MNSIERKALTKLKNKVLELDDKAILIIYGSKVRGDFDNESDIDILIVLNKPLKDLKYKIMDIATEIELEYDVVFGLVIISKIEFLYSPIFKQSLYYENLKREGVILWKMK